MGRIRMNRVTARMCCAGLIATLPMLAGCGGAGGSGNRIAAPSVPGTRVAEPTGGSWRPFVLTSGDSAVLAASLTPPEDINSPAVLGDIDELRALQRQRTEQTQQSVAFWDAGAVVRWNEIARDLVAKNKTPPPLASRVYALLSVAQYDGLVAAWSAKYRYNRLPLAAIAPAVTPTVAVPTDPAYPSEHAVVAGASAAVLSALFPAEAAALEAKATEHETSRLWAGVNLRSDVSAGDGLGRAVAAHVLERAQTDGASAAGAAVAIPTGPGMWTGTKALLPGWGQVRGWYLSSGSELRPTPPPALDSPEFQAALSEVRQISDTRTAEQLRIAQFWADGAGTATPPGHWNQIACEHLLAQPTNELRAARVLALLNTAMMDAGICCWDAKYAYWLARPSMLDPAITLPVGLPNFPSYTSGHSTFSGAAATVLGYVFPDQAAAYGAMADEAGMSRVYGGIHYRFDSELGLAGGRKIGAMAVERAQTDGAP